MLILVTIGVGSDVRDESATAVTADALFPSITATSRSPAFIPFYPVSGFDPGITPLTSVTAAAFAWR
jgi:hypothetical protein